MSYDDGCVRCRTRLLTATGIALALALAGLPADAGAKKKAKAASTAGRKTAPRAQPKDAKDPPPLPAPQGKLVVFPFAGEGGQRVQQQVMSVLRMKGMKLISNLRPVDSAEQYREMAMTLNVIGYVDGEYAGEGDQASATVYIRSGITGLRATSTTFAGERRTLPSEVGKALWERILPDLSKLCVEAAKPRKLEHAPLRIEAGTPLENHPANGSD
jgi:hypothetical protein